MKYHKMIGGILLFLANAKATTNTYPHLGVRYIYANKTPVYDINNPDKEKTFITEQTGVVPCIVLQKNGEPLTGPKGEVLIGIQKKIFSAPKATPNGNDLNAMSAFYVELNKERTRQTQEIEETTVNLRQPVSDMNCDDKVTEAVPISALSPNKNNLLKLSPAPNALNDAIKTIKTATTAVGKPKTSLCTVKSADCTPMGLVEEFHNSKQCLGAELQFGNRKEAYLNAWKEFIQSKKQGATSAEKGKGLEQNIARAMEIDIMTRTVVFESDIGRGCSDAGTCEKNLILLSLRNRAHTKKYCNKAPYNQYPPGVCVAIPEDQYNIWSELYADMSYLTSCFLRSERQPEAQGDAKATWINADQKVTYQKLIKMFKKTAAKGEEIFTADETTLKKYFALDNSKSPSDLYNYYHPPAMPSCYPNINNLYRVSEAYVKCPSNKGFSYFALRNEFIQVTDLPKEGLIKFKLMRANAQAKNTDGELSPVDLYSTCTLDARRVTPARKIDRCSSLGLPTNLAKAFSNKTKEKEKDKCSRVGPNYFRKIPDWSFNDTNTPKITCRGVEDSGKSCNESAHLKDHKIGGKCETRMIPVTGGA